MAESIVKDFKGKLDWVYVGKSEAPKPIEKKADTLLNEYMRKVLDVVVPVAVAETAETAAVQNAIASETVGLVSETNKEKYIKKWLELDGKEHKLGKLLTSAVFMAGSFGLNYASEWAAKLGLDTKETFLFVSLEPKSGNKKMLEAGWQYITDLGIEKAADHSAKWLTNREDIGFISPLSRTIGKIGNTIMNVTGLLGQYDNKSMLKKSMLNPGFIEGAFRFVGSVPGMGFFKEIYGKANSQIMKGEGLIPLGADLAFNMMFAKFSGQMEGKSSPGEEVAGVKPNRAMLGDDAPKKLGPFE